MNKKIFEYRIAKRDGKWHQQGKRLTYFTENTVPKLHEWLKRDSDSLASYFAFEGERPQPLFPPIDRELTEVTITDEQKTAIAAQQKKGCGCGNKKRSVTVTDPTRTKTPTDDCWICAEKHLGSAYDTYAKEHGYRELNRIHYIGALNDAENHLAGIVPKYAEEIRRFRHDIQIGREKSDFDWQNLIKKFYDLKDETQFTELSAKKFDKIYLFSNVESSVVVPVTEKDLLVFINKAIPADRYNDHPHKICFHRSDKPEYGKRRFDMPNRFVFGKNGIPNTEIEQIKADYDWNYEIEPGKVKSCSTGYMVAQHLDKHYPDSKLILVNFGFEVKNSTYRCPWHNWQFEAERLKNFTHIYTTEVQDNE
jgi:hypothetical protein